MGASQKDSNEDSAVFAGARRLYMQRSTDGFGFLFTSSPSSVDRGISHLVSKVDPGSPAYTSGLAVGDRILKVNDSSVVNVSHRQLVRLMQEAPPHVPLSLVVCALQLVTAEVVRLNGGADGVSVSSESMSTRSGTASRPNDNVRMVVIVIRDPVSANWLALRLSNVSFTFCIFFFLWFSDYTGKGMVVTSRTGPPARERSASSAPCNNNQDWPHHQAAWGAACGARRGPRQAASHHPRPAIGYACFHVNSIEF
jgi:hypothetical protein